MTVKLLTKQHLELLSLKGSCTGSSESIHVKSHIVGNLMSRLILANSADHDELLLTPGSTLHVPVSIQERLNHNNCKINKSEIAQSWIKFFCNTQV